jgi:hypothetical protein
MNPAFFEVILRSGLLFFGLDFDLGFLGLLGVLHNLLGGSGFGLGRRGGGSSCGGRCGSRSSRSSSRGSSGGLGGSGGGVTAAVVGAGGDGDGSDQATKL